MSKRRRSKIERLQRNKSVEPGLDSALSKKNEITKKSDKKPLYKRLDFWTLIAAIIGIIVTIYIFLFQENKKQAYVTYKTEFCSIGERMSPVTGQMETVVFLCSSFINTGGSAVATKLFRLKFENNGKLTPLMIDSVPRDLNLYIYGKRYHIQFPDAYKKDLQKLEGIEPTGIPVRGTLLFVSPIKLSELIEIKNQPFVLICVDENRRTLEYHDTLRMSFDVPPYDPKLGMKFVQD